MPANSWGAVNSSTSYTDNYCYTDNGVYPSGRAMFNGSTAVLITALTAYVSGRSGARTIVLTLGSAATAGFAVGSASSAASVGWVSTNQVLVNGGNARFTIDMNGSAYFGRATSGSGYDSYGTAFGTMYGGAYYAQAPVAPTGVTLSAIGATGIKVTWVAPSDNGESAITGYAIQRASTASFTDAVTTTVGNVLTTDLTGLTAGNNYYVRVMGRNAVTTAAGTYGVASTYASLKLPSGAYVGDGTNWPAGEITVGDGTNWKAPEVLIGDGTNWNPAQ